MISLIGLWLSGCTASKNNPSQSISQKVSMKLEQKTIKSLMTFTASNDQLPKQEMTTTIDLEQLNIDTKDYKQKDHPNIELFKGLEDVSFDVSYNKNIVLWTINKPVLIS